MESSLAQVEHQIWLLRNVHWWYLLPLALSALPFFGQVAWQERSGGWWTALGVSMVVALVVIVLAVIYWLNQYAVRSELEPRRRELETHAHESRGRNGWGELIIIALEIDLRPQAKKER